MKYPLFFALTFFTAGVQAKVEALFHPRDPTLERIADWIAQAEHQVDIAMYNMDVTDASPVVQVLKSAPVAARVAA